MVIPGPDERADPIAQGAVGSEQATAVIRPGRRQQQPVLQQCARPLRPQHRQRFFGSGSRTMAGEVIVRPLGMEQGTA